MKNNKDKDIVSTDISLDLLRKSNSTRVSSQTGDGFVMLMVAFLIFSILILGGLVTIIMLNNVSEQTEPQQATLETLVAQQATSINTLQQENATLQAHLLSLATPTPIPTSVPTSSPLPGDTICRGRILIPIIDVYREPDNATRIRSYEGVANTEVLVLRYVAGLNSNWYYILAEDGADNSLPSNAVWVLAGAVHSGNISRNQECLRQLRNKTTPPANSKHQHKHGD